MGKVFSWLEVSTGKVPDLNSFKVVQDQIIAELERCNEILGGIVCGSVLRGDHNVRSDLDCLVVHTGRNIIKTIGLLQEINTFAKQLYVPLEFIPVDVRVAHTPTVEVSFGIHLNWSVKNGGCIKKNPIPLLSLNSNLELELQNYIRLKLDKLMKRWIKYPSSNDRQRFLFLQKILEAPVYIARKIIRWRGIDISTDDSKRRVADLYSEYSNGSKSLKFFKQAVVVDMEYTAKLLQQLECANEAEYSEALAEIEAIVPNVLEFISLTKIIVNKKK